MKETGRFAFQKGFLGFWAGIGNHSVGATLWLVRGGTIRHLCGMKPVPQALGGSAIVVTDDTASCVTLVDALAAAGCGATVRRSLADPPGDVGVFCLDVRSWRRSGRPLEEAGVVLDHGAPTGGTRLLLLYDGDGSVAGWPDDAFRRTVRSLANALAPAFRANAIVSDPNAGGTEGALRLILGSPSMTGQTLRLAAAPRPGSRPSLEGMPPPGAPRPAPDARVRRMFIRDLVLSAFIGVHRHERAGRQRVRLNVDLEVMEDGAETGDRLADVVCYETMAEKIRAATCNGHVNLVETLAERIAAICLADARVALARVRIEKLDIFEDAFSAGVEIERRQEDRQRNPKVGG